MTDRAPRRAVGRQDITGRPQAGTQGRVAALAGCIGETPRPATSATPTQIECPEELDCPTDVECELFAPTQAPCLRGARPSAEPGVKQLKVIGVFVRLRAARGNWQNTTVLGKIPHGEHVVLLEEGPGAWRRVRMTDAKLGTLEGSVIAYAKNDDGKLAHRLEVVQ
jgi:hypothetical protein